MSRGVNVAIPEKFAPLFTPARYKVFWGGRGGAKSWNIARALLLQAATSRLRVLCAREFQSSIADSVHRLLSDQIAAMGLDACFTIQQRTIVSTTGSEFLFKGLRHSIQEIKSTEGVDRVWIEEAQSVSGESWDILIPTIRKQSSEVWISFNPVEESDPTFARFVKTPPPDSIVVKVGWQDNPYFPRTLDQERRYMLSIDPIAYGHIWEGECKAISDAVIFGKRISVEAFETPAEARFFYGADWGFANDPTALVRSFVKDECLYIDQEAVGYGVEIDETPALFDSLPGARDWPIKADGARPETISFMRRKGFQIDAAEKWPGSVEDGIKHLLGFRKIVIHERCKNMQTEARLYSYKVDKVTGDILPIIVDKHNHCIDAIRYALGDYIKSRGGLGVWAKLAS